MITNVYTCVQEQIRFADTKAGFVAAFNAILASFIVSNLNAVKEIYKNSGDRNLCLFLVAAVLLTGIPAAVSIGYLIWAVRPRLGKNTNKSKIFFVHIARDYTLNGNQYSKDTYAMGESDWADDFGHQIVEVANIATKKHAYVRVSMNWGFAAFASLCVVSLAVHLVPLLLNKV
jgi:hypothetical protein